MEETTTSANDDMIPILSAEEFYRLKQDFEAKYACVPSAVKMSTLTQKLLTKDFALIPSDEPYNTLYGIPLITDDTVPFNRFQMEFRRKSEK